MRLSEFSRADWLRIIGGLSLAAILLLFAAPLAWYAAIPLPLSRFAAFAIFGVIGSGLAVAFARDRFSHTARLSAARVIIVAVGIAEFAYFIKHGILPIAERWETPDAIVFFLGVLLIVRAIEFADVFQKDQGHML